jgi:hypothetical protein
MKSFALFAAICAVALSAEGTKTANATTITNTINFTASGFPADAPVASVTGSFTITLDPMAFVQPPEAMVTLNSISFSPVFSPPSFEYQPNILGGQLLVCASEHDCSQTIINSFFSYFLTITNFQSAPTFSAFDYEGGGASPGRIFQAATGSVSVVPAPIVGAGLPGLIVACGGRLALARRRRRSSSPEGGVASLS